jgi:hypothetical protein
VQVRVLDLFVVRIAMRRAAKVQASEDRHSPSAIVHAYKWLPDIVWDAGRTCWQRLAFVRPATTRTLCGAGIVATFSGKRQLASTHGFTALPCGLDPRIPAGRLTMQFRGQRPVQEQGVIVGIEAPARVLRDLVRDRLVRWHHSQKSAHRGISLYYRPATARAREQSFIEAATDEAAAADAAYYGQLALSEATGWDRIALDPLVA